jgi:hypothetical protein
VCRSADIFGRVYSFFWVIPRRLNFMCRRFGTFCQFHLRRSCNLFTRPMKMEQSVPKRRYIKSRAQVISQTKEYNIQNTTKVWEEE